MDCITDKAGYKYQLKRPYRLEVPVYPDRPIERHRSCARATGGG
jgi:hypothetical protein